MTLPLAVPADVPVREPSPLMSESEAMAYLGADARLFRRLLVERGLRRHPVYKRLFCRADVLRVAAEIAEEIEREGQMGRQEPQMGSEQGLRPLAQVVP